MRFLTKRGLGFILTAVGLFVLGDATRTGWVQIADAVFWGAIVVSAVVAFTSSGGLSVTPRLALPQSAQAKAPAQGDEVEVSVDIVNHWPLPRFGVTVSFNVHVNGALTTHSADERVKFYVPFLAPRARTTVHGAMRPPLRGAHRLADGVVTSVAPFGLFRRSQRQRTETSMLVLPAAVEVAVTASRLVQAGERPKPITARAGEEAAGSRPYAIGDAMRDIHWRNSARAGRMMTKAYTATEQELPVLLVAGGGARANPERGLDDRCRVAAGVALACGTDGMPLALLAGRDVRQPTWPETLSWLACLTSASIMPMRDQLNRLASAMAVAAVVDADDEEAVHALMAGAPRLSTLHVWLLAAEIDDVDWRTNQAASALRGAGVWVTVVSRPLPAPEGRP